jgi:hypothetical protein
MAMKAKMDVPAYPRATWDDGAIVKTRADGAREIAIAANRAGLISLARHLVTLALETVPSGYDLHYSDLSILEEGSVQLHISKLP